MPFKQFVLILILILFPLLLGAYFPDGIQASRQLSTSVTQPIFETTHQIGAWFRDQARDFAHLLRTNRENQELREQIGVLEGELSQLKEIRQENERLRQLLKFQKNSTWRTISAQVIGRDLSHWSYHLLINKGSRDGVYVDMPVAAGDGLIGKVTDVTPGAAHVILLIDPDSRVSGIVQETRDVGLVEGSGGPLLRMTYLDLHAQLQVGQTVVTSGMGGLYPKGIPVGMIVQIGEETNHLGLYAIVKPHAAFSKLEEVLCLDVKPREK